MTYQIGRLPPALGYGVDHLCSCAFLQVSIMFLRSELWEGTAKLECTIENDSILVLLCPGFGSQFGWEGLEIVENHE